MNAITDEEKLKLEATFAKSLQLAQAQVTITDLQAENTRLRDTVISLGTVIAIMNTSSHSSNKVIAEQNITISNGLERERLDREAYGEVREINKQLTTDRDAARHERDIAKSAFYELKASVAHM